jgi:hypothetical protein
MTYGIKISLPGYDVKTATPEQLALSSDYISPKLRLNQSPAHAGIVSYTVPTSFAAFTTVNILTVNHGYSYTPAALCHWTGYTDNVVATRSFGTAPMQLITSPDMRIIAYCTPTQFKIDAYRGNDFGFGPSIPAPIGGQTVNLRYYILAESGT